MKFRLNKTEIELSYTLLCLAAIAVILNVFQRFLWCALAIAVHECGHLVVMLKYGYFPEKIKISLCEISILDSSRHKRSNRENFFIIFFGPFVNFVCFIVFYLLYLLGCDICLPFATANLFVGLMNILPVSSLDGGQLLYLAVSGKHSAKTAERVVNIAAVITIFPLAAAGFVLLFQSKYNFSLLSVCVYLIISLLTRGGEYY